MSGVGGDSSINVFDAAIRVHAVWLIVISSLVVTGLKLFYSYTRLGQAMLAASIDVNGSLTIGINVPLMRTLTFVAGGLMGGLAGVLVAPLINIHYEMGLLLTLKGFAAAILGGLTSPLGAVFGGVTLGPCRISCNRRGFVRLQGRDRNGDSDPDHDRDAAGAAGSARSPGRVRLCPTKLTGLQRRLLGWLGSVLLIAAWAVIPLLAGRSTVDLFVFAALYAIAGLGVAFLLGQCGIVSLAQNVFFGIGAYSTAYGATALGWPAPASMITGMAISGCIAAVVGAPVLKLSGYFLALATLALAIIGHVLFLEWEWLTGGTLGIGGVPPISLFGYPFNTPLRFYYLVWPIVLIVILIHRNVLNSRTGIAMRAMRRRSIGGSGARREYRST